MWTLRRTSLSLLGIALASACAAIVVTADQWRTDGESYLAVRNAQALPLAVLGDSDSHAYQDTVSFPPSSGKRGGVHRAATLQWTEVLARVRPAQLDGGEWGVWGVPRPVARVQRLLGLQERAPRKQDHRFNFAISGAGCETLSTGGGRQAQRLLALMDRDPSRWRQGIVVIRIGVNDFGMDDALERLARDPADATVQRAIGRCIEQVEASIALLRQRHAQVRIVLVGIFDNAHWPRYAQRWQSAREIGNIERGLDVYDAALARLAAADPRIAFFDDRAWFAQRWGGRDASGRPAYRSVVLASGFEVRNTMGDEPQHAVIADGHAGLVWNVLWAQSLLALLNERFGLALTPIDDREAARFVEQTRGGPH